MPLYLKYILSFYGGIDIPETEGQPRVEEASGNFTGINFGLRKRCSLSLYYSLFNTDVNRH